MEDLSTMEEALYKEFQAQQLTYDLKICCLPNAHSFAQGVLHVLRGVNLHPDKSELVVRTYTPWVWQNEHREEHAYFHLELHFNERDTWEELQPGLEELSNTGIVPVEDWKSEDLPMSFTRLFTARIGRDNMQIYWQLREDNAGGCYRKHVRKEVRTTVDEHDVWELICPGT